MLSELGVLHSTHTRSQKDKGYMRESVWGGARRCVLLYCLWDPSPLEEGFICCRFTSFTPHIYLLGCDLHEPTETGLQARAFLELEMCITRRFLHKAVCLRGWKSFNELGAKLVKHSGRLIHFLSPSLPSFLSFFFT